jgi:hypothetical protein
MFSSKIRGWAQGGTHPASSRRRVATRAVVTVESLEGRMLLSRFFFDHHLGIVVNNYNDVRDGLPRFAPGTGTDVHPRFAPFYQGPQEAQLLGISASAKVSLDPTTHKPSTITLTGTVAGPINTKPQTTTDGAIYTFGFDTGGASKTGPFPGLPNIRFNAVVVVSVTPKGVTGYSQYINSLNIQTTSQLALKSSAISIKGNTLTVSLPADAFPSSGNAIDKWTVEFFPRYPATPLKISDVASLVPNHTNFQVYYPPFTANYHPPKK